MTEFEKAALTFILENEAKEYLSHIQSLKVTSREIEDVGFYVNFEYIKKEKNTKKETVTLGKRVCANVNDMENEVGFMLYIEDDLIKTLEVFSQSYDSIPRTINIYNFFYYY